MIVDKISIFIKEQGTKQQIINNGTNTFPEGIDDHMQKNPTNLS